MVAASRGDTLPALGCFATLARTAQIRARDVGRQNTAGPRSIAGAANLLAMATTHGQGTQAEAMLFRQLMRTAQAIYSMHMAAAVEHDAELTWDSAELRELHVESIKADPDRAAAATAWK